MRIAFFTPENWLLEVAGALDYLGHEITVNRIDQADVIVCMSSSVMKEVKRVWRGEPLINYNWDTYHWQFDNPRPEDTWIEEYKDFLSKSTKILVPSEATRIAMGECYNLSIPVEVVNAFVPLHHLAGVVREEKGHVFHAMRDYPLPELHQLQDVCDEVGLPLIRSRNALPLAEYIEALRGASVVVSHYSEASTGGLAIQEAAYLGIPVICHGGPYNGGREYLGDAAAYFTTREELTSLVKEHRTSPTFTPRTLTDMARDICASI